MTFFEFVALLGNAGQFVEGALALVLAVIAYRSGLIERLKEFRHTKREENRARVAETLWARATQLHKMCAFAIETQGEMRREKAERTLQMFREAYLGFVEETARAMLILPVESVATIDAYSDAVTPVFTGLVDVTVVGEHTVAVTLPFRKLSELESPFLKMKDELQVIATFGELNP